MGKNPLKAPRHHSRWKLQPTYNTANIYQKKSKTYIRIQKFNELKMLKPST